MIASWCQWKSFGWNDLRRDFPLRSGLLLLRIWDSLGTRRNKWMPPWVVRCDSSRCQDLLWWKVAASRRFSMDLLLRSHSWCSHLALIAAMLFGNPTRLMLFILPSRAFASPLVPRILRFTIRKDCWPSLLTLLTKKSPINSYSYSQPLTQLFHCCLP